jgi:hypothetical protein
MVLGERHTADGLLLSPAGVDYCEFVQTSYSTYHHTTHIDSDPRQSIVLTSHVRRTHV